MSHNLWKNSICERMIVERQIIFQYNENNFDLADSLKDPRRYFENLWIMVPLTKE